MLRHTHTQQYLLPGVIIAIFRLSVIGILLLRVGLLLLLLLLLGVLRLGVLRLLISVERQTFQ
jgi:hypothetical protein